eukprot:jgi/Ulvmu1/5269/UM022_0063.1
MRLPDSPCTTCSWRTVFCRDKFCKVVATCTQELSGSSMSSQAANAGAYVPASQAQASAAVCMNDMPQVLFWDASGAQQMGIESAKSLAVAHPNPQPTETLDERELKRLRRKQNNRESARRSRQRKADEISQLTDQVSKRDADVILLQETVKVLAQHVKDLSKKVKEMGGSVDPAVDAATELTQLMAQTSECRADTSQSTAHIPMSRNSDDQPAVTRQAVTVDAVVVGPGSQQVGPSGPPAPGT